jgi:hypothetical protein
VSPPPEHLLHECTNESHGCIRMNATCLVNAMWTTATLMLYSNHFTTCANLFSGREVLTQSTQPNV